MSHLHLYVKPNPALELEAQQAMDVLTRLAQLVTEHINDRGYPGRWASLLHDVRSAQEAAERIRFFAHEEAGDQ